MSDREDYEIYLKLHNAVVGIYWDMVNNVAGRDEIVARLKKAVEASAGMTMEDVDRLMIGMKEE